MATLITPRLFQTHVGPTHSRWFSPGFVLDDTIGRVQLYLASAHGFGRVDADHMARALAITDRPVGKTIQAIATVVAGETERDLPLLLALGPDGTVIEIWQSRKASWRKLRARLRAEGRAA